MITPNRIEEVDNFYRRFFEDAILHDLKIMTSTREGLNLIITSAILSATNLLGNLCEGNSSNKSLEAFIRDYFPTKYREHASIIGGFFRNSLVHTAYAPRGAGISRGRSDLHLTVKNTVDGYAYVIDSDQLYEDFRLAVKNYFEKVKSDESLLEKFESYLDKLERQFPHELEPHLTSLGSASASISNATYYPYPIRFDEGD